MGRMRVWACMGMYGGQRDLEMHTIRVKCDAMRCDANKSDHDTIEAQTNTNKPIIIIKYGNAEHSDALKEAHIKSIVVQ